MVLILNILMLINFECRGQKYGVLEPEEIDNISVNTSLNMLTLLNPGNGWQQIQSTFGNITPVCDSSSGHTNCKFNYQGAELHYSNYLGNFDLAEASFTNSNHSITYKVL